jgi:hypothetical protein
MVSKFSVPELGLRFGVFLHKKRSKQLEWWSCNYVWGKSPGYLRVYQGTRGGCSIRNLTCIPRYTYPRVRGHLLCKEQKIFLLTLFLFLECKIGTLCICFLCILIDIAYWSCFWTDCKPKLFVYVMCVLCVCKSICLSCLIWLWFYCC